MTIINHIAIVPNIYSKKKTDFAADYNCMHIIDFNNMGVGKTTELFHSFSHYYFVCYVT